MKKGDHRYVQVYRGRLRSTGEEVALKVQRPGIGEQICLDMVLLRRLMMAVDTTLPKLKLPIQVCPHCPFPPLQVLPTLSNIWQTGSLSAFSLMCLQFECHCWMRRSSP